METLNSSDQQGPTDWNRLADTPDTAPAENHHEKLLNRAALYRKFGSIALTMCAIENAKQNQNRLADQTEITITPEDAQADALIKQLERALGDVDQSLTNQIDYDIINHKQINTKEALEHELQSGTSIPELDIRFDEEGRPWISHSPRAGARFLFSPHIHKLNSAAVEQEGQRLSLEEGLDIFKKYQEDNPNHRVVLEIKELGASPASHAKLLGNLKDLLATRELTDTAIFATLSPSILKSIHKAFPDNSKILNGGIAPVISYDLAANSTAPARDQEFAFKLPGVELFFSNSTEIKDHADGYGKQTGYLWTRLPKETIDTLKKMNQDGKIGAASLTVVNKFANLLDKLSPRTAEKLRRHYAEQLDQLGIRKQVAISKKNPRENLLKTKAQMGQDSIIYSDTSPGDWATDLPPKSET